MKRKRWTEPQIVFALRQADEGTSVGEICRKMGVAEATFYRWRKRYGGLVVRDPSATAIGGGESPAEVSGGGPESRQGDIAGRAEKKSMKPVRRRAVVQYVQAAWEVP